MLNMYQPPIKGQPKKIIQPLKQKSKDNLADSMYSVAQTIGEMNDLKNEVIDVVDSKLQEVDTMVEQATQDIGTAIEEAKLIKKGEDGKPGQDAQPLDEEKVINEVLGRIKIPVSMAQPIDENKIINEILSKIPQIDEKKLKKDILKSIPTPKTDLKVIQENVEVDPISVIEKIMALPEEKRKNLKFNLDNIDGLKQTIAAMQSQLGRGYLHGGGLSNITGYIQAGFDISITGSGTLTDPYIINSTFTQVQADWYETDRFAPSFIANHYVTQFNAADSFGNLDVIKPPTNWIYITSGQYDITKLVNANEIEYDDITIAPVVERMSERIIDYPSMSEIKIAGLFTYTFQPGDPITITGSINNNGNYIVASSSDDGTDTTVTITTSTLTVSPVDGTLNWNSHVIVNVLSSDVSSGNLQFNNDAPWIRLDGWNREFLVVRYDVYTRSYLQTGGNILPDNLIAVTYASAGNLANNKYLNPGQKYIITDRGDNGLIFEAVSISQFNNLGTRRMWCPANYAISSLSGFNWLGVWRSTNTPSTGDLCIWGGKVWSNTSGSNGSVVNDYTLLPAAWTEVAKSSQSVVAGVYVEMPFGISYKFKEDWIEKQWDDNGNIMGVSWEEQRLLYGFAVNPVDLTDWNYETAAVVFAENECIGVYNNFIETIYSTSSSSYLVGLIQGNKIPGIINRNLSNMSNNTCNGSITQNGTNTISGNSCNGGIIANKSANFIVNNTNNGQIRENEVGGIFLNSNNGEISSNINTKGLGNNSNNGSITGSGSLIKDITFNHHNGSITNCNVNGNITQNGNNGNIIGATSVVPVNVANCFNNGTVGPAVYIANVGTAIVNL